MRKRCWARIWTITRNKIKIIYSLYDCGTNRVKLNGIHDRALSKRERQKFEAMQVPFSMTLIGEKDFYPTKQRWKWAKQNAQEYHQARLKAFYSPNKNEIKNVDWCKFYNKDTLAFYDDTKLLGELTAPVTIKNDKNKRLKTT